MQCFANWKGKYCKNNKNGDYNNYNNEYYTINRFTTL